jgi:hypothetical protein
MRLTNNASEPPLSLSLSDLTLQTPPQLYQTTPMVCMPTSKHNNITLNIFRHRYFRNFNW